MELKNLKLYVVLNKNGHYLRSRSGGYWTYNSTWTDDPEEAKIFLRTSNAKISIMCALERDNDLEFPNIYQLELVESLNPLVKDEKFEKKFELHKVVTNIAKLKRIVEDSKDSARHIKTLVDKQQYKKKAKMCEDLLNKAEEKLKELQKK